jgi:hypothetical protein
MFCKNCGAELSDAAKFCTSCGTRLVAGPAIQTQPTWESMGVQDSRDDLSSKSMFDIAHTARGNGAQNVTPVPVPSGNQQPAAAKSTLSKSGVTALVLSIVTFVVEMITVSYMVVDGWFGYYSWNGRPSISTDWIIGYVPLYFACLLSIIFGSISIYGKRTKYGLAGVIITFVNITGLLAGHVIALMF